MSRGYSAGVSVARGPSSNTAASRLRSLLIVAVSLRPDRSRSPLSGAYQASPNSVRADTISCTVDMHSPRSEAFEDLSIAARLPAVRTCEARSSSPRNVISCVSRPHRYTAARKPASCSRMTVCVASNGVYSNRLAAASRSAIADISRCLSAKAFWCLFDRFSTDTATQAATPADMAAPRNPDQSWTQTPSSTPQSSPKTIPRNMGLSLREAP